MSKPRILVVEDETIIADHLAQLLEQTGYGIAGIVHSGEDAVKAAEESLPDLVLMDIVLEGDLDGVEAAGAIRSRLGIPVVYLTAYSDDGILARAKETEPFGYLLKPVRKDALRTGIEMAFYKSRMERQLRESEARFRELAELLPQSVYETDLSGDFTYVNRNTLHSFGYEADDVASGLNIFDIVAEADRTKVAGAIRDILNEQDRAEFEFTARRKDESTFPALAYADPVLRDGQVAGIRGIAVDITELKRYQQELEAAKGDLEKRVEERTAELRKAVGALRASEERFRAIFRSATDCIFVKDPELRYTDANPAMESLLGRSRDRLLGRTDEELYGKRAAARIREVELRVLGGESIETEQTRPVKGADLTFLDIRVPLKDKEGGIVGLCGISRNITERKRVVPHADAAVADYPSKAMRRTLRQALQAAATDSTILLLGESGSGKDFLARHIHDNSNRADGPFFAMNCAALAQELAESELFGHEAGSFTGARGRVRGLLELAEGGTLLLNEIGELPATIQAKLLSFLDTKTFCRVGGRKTIEVDARLIAATNRDLKAEVDEGRFRQDLFYRLNVFSVTVPPLRERKEDIPMLVEEIVAELATELRLTSAPAVDAEVLEQLTGYKWPGNVRELRNVLEHGLILSPGSKLTIEPMAGEAFDATEWYWTVGFPPPESINEAVNNMRRRMIAEALRRSGGNKQEAARLLGISRFSLRRQMQTLGM
jgi:PAS domain S-box-containing protein